MPRRRGTPWAAVVALVMGGAALGAASAGAQEDVASLTERCAPAVLEAVCQEWALTAQAAHADVGLLAAGGAQLPGASSTLGRRFGGMPRFSWGLRGSLLRGELPVAGTPATSTPWEGEGYTGLGVHGSLALGLFDGFSPLPTVGGLLSLDVLGSVGYLLLPQGPGFQDDPRYAGAGVRVGLLRESFTLPGVTISAARRWVGEVEVASGGVVARVDPVVTSVRGVVGKDLLSLGFLAGVGWDRYASDGDLGFPAPCPGSCSLTSFEDLRSERVLFFGGASLNLLLLQLSAEGGWARGFEQPEGRSQGGYDPGSGTPFLSLAARLTL